MNDLGERLRDALTEEARSHRVNSGLCEAAVSRGAHLKRRRHAHASVLAVVAVIGVAVGVRALPGITSTTHQGVIQAARGSSSTPAKADKRATLPPGSSAGPAVPTALGWWTTWLQGRSFGQPIDAAFKAALAPGENIAIYANGTLPDGQRFAMFLDAMSPGRIQWVAGSLGNAWGEGDAIADASTNVSAFETPTLQGRQADDSEQWLIVAAQPQATEIDFSTDGIGWNPMETQNGIGVAKLPTIAASGTRIRALEGIDVLSTTTIPAR